MRDHQLQNFLYGFWITMDFTKISLDFSLIIYRMINNWLQVHSWSWIFIYNLHWVASYFCLCLYIYRSRDFTGIHCLFLDFRFQRISGGAYKIWQQLVTPWACIACFRIPQGHCSNSGMQNMHIINWLAEHSLARLLTAL